jgi:lipoprotein signal peptidase
MRAAHNRGARVIGLSWRQRRGHPQILLLATLVVFTLDQGSKAVARAFQLGASAQNNSHPVHSWWVLPLLGIVAALAPSRRVALFSSLFIGGFLGNLVDQRFWPGGIPDFISFDEFYWNLADLFIVAGLALLLTSPFVRLGTALIRRRPRVATESSLGS